jgi:hypothetical protein
MSDEDPVAEFLFKIAGNAQSFGRDRWMGPSEMQREAAEIRKIIQEESLRAALPAIREGLAREIDHQSTPFTGNPEWQQGYNRGIAVAAALIRDGER